MNCRRWLRFHGHIIIAQGGARGGSAISLALGHASKSGVRDVIPLSKPQQREYSPMIIYCARCDTIVEMLTVVRSVSIELGRGTCRAGVPRDTEIGGSAFHDRRYP